MLVSDITERKTFDHVVRWIDELRANADNSIVVVLIGSESSRPKMPWRVCRGTRTLLLGSISTRRGQRGDCFPEASGGDIYGVISRKALECDEARRNAASDVLALKGTTVSVLPPPPSVNDGN
ncbi:hypothetical protein OPV22_015959 [Ensete ventricosum]|uniref:Uncharacterized protein n=1 Tax=Ensete ventricosum TaxID=4639 RepID=A0AAV8R6L1_ENSVE|nr:hypothetical protein OPV22_015959 [Ensete ventricosum]